MSFEQRRQVFTKYRPFLFLSFLVVFVWASICSEAWCAVTAANPSVELVRESAPVGDDMAVFQESKPLVTRAGAWHTWKDHIHLAQGQEKSRLLLTFTNGAEGRAKFTDLKVLLGRKPYATLKDFAGADVLSCNLTGKLTRGNTALEVQGFGPSGARLNWRVHIQRPLVTKVKPDPVGLSETVTAEGSGFSEHASDTKVLVAGKPAKLVASKSTELQLKLPAHVSSGSQDLIVVVNSVESKPFKVSVKSSPQITWVDMLASTPGNTVTLSGSGFSPVLSENKVTLGKTPARITAATASSITFVIPDMHYPNWHVPITVTTNGMPSKSKASINLNQFVVPNEGVPMH
jgi:hypothetical protein